MDLMSRRPEDFAEPHWLLANGCWHSIMACGRAFLDITSNPMVALFHASEDNDANDPTDGRVHVFATPRSLVSRIAATRSALLRTLRNCRGTSGANLP